MSQPLFYHPGKGLNGLITQKINGVLHFLIRACSYPGNRELFELGSTVTRSDYLGSFGDSEEPAFLHLFRNPRSGTVRFTSVQSEKGGRFFNTKINMSFSNYLNTLWR